MPKFSRTSLDRLATCEIQMQRLMHEVIKTYDITIVCGHRGPADQLKAWEAGNSKVLYPNSKHNPYPSRAVDIAPYVSGIDWDDVNSFYLLAGYVLRISEEMDIPIRLGGDFNSNRLTNDDGLRDPGHLELI